MSRPSRVNVGLWEAMKRKMQPPPTPPSKRNTSSSLFFRCLDLVLPWLTPQELAMASLTCTTLRNLSKSITLRRASDASRSLEPHPIPFHNSLDQHPYAYFIYTPSSLTPSSSSSSSLLRQPWGSGHHESDSDTRTETSSLRFVDESGNCASSGCECEETCEDGKEGCPCVVGFFAGFDGVVFECGPSCGCRLSCGNRLTRTGIQVKLKMCEGQKKRVGFVCRPVHPKGSVCVRVCR